MKPFALVLTVISLTGCASITAGTTQSIAISTVPNSGASCKLANEKGNWTVDPTPGSTTVSKAYGALTITCADKQGDKGIATLQSTTAGAAFGNIVAGGIIGAAVDMSTGAAYVYPSTATVSLTPVAAVAKSPAKADLPPSGQDQASK